MSASLPPDIKHRIREKVWAKADELIWSKISAVERAKWYENWSKDKEIGGALSHFMDTRNVRVYIKDSLLKPYLRARLQVGVDKVLLALAVKEHEARVKANYDKPHGLLLFDGRIICWGNSRDWKAVVFSVFERAYSSGSAIAYAAALVETGQTENEGIREMIKEASRRLGLAKIVWVE